MKGETHTYHWDPKTDESFDYPKGPGTIDLPTGANIQVVNLKSTEKAFQIVWPRGTHFDSYNGEKSYSMFEAWNHWPVAQIASSGRPAVAADRTSHTSLSHIYWDEYGKDEQTETKLLLSGLTSLSPSQLLPLAKSWISPPAVKVVEGDSAGAEYDPSQRAFVVHRSATAKAGGLTLKLAASAETPIVNPAFVIENWSGPVKVTVSRKGGKWDVPVRIGYSTRLESVSLVLYMGLTSNEETQVRVDPALK
jgi:hypothetical protein